MRVVYFGTPDFSVPTLEMLSKHPLVEIISVVSMPDRPAGRGQELKSPKVIEFCRKAKIPFIQTENINKEFEAIKKWEDKKIDLFIVLAFAQFLGEKLLSLPLQGCFNIHTSLLPKYRGAAPIQYAVWNGDLITGVSIQRMVKKMDAGDLVHSHLVEISPNETGGELSNKLKSLAAVACNDFLEKVISNKIVYVPQDEKDVSFAPTLSKRDGFLDFNSQTVSQIMNRIRAMDPWPGTYCFLSGKRLKVLKAQVSTEKVATGKVASSKSQLTIGCLDGAIRLSLVQLEGKKTSSDQDLLNGFREQPQLTPPPLGTT